MQHLRVRLSLHRRRPQQAHARARGTHSPCHALRTAFSLLFVTRTCSSSRASQIFSVFYFSPHIAHRGTHTHRLVACVVYLASAQDVPPPSSPKPTHKRPPTFSWLRGLVDTSPLPPGTSRPSLPRRRLPAPSRRRSYRTFSTSARTTIR